MQARRKNKRKTCQDKGNRIASGLTGRLTKPWYSSFPSLRGAEARCLVDPCASHERARAAHRLCTPRLTQPVLVINGAVAWHRGDKHHLLAGGAACRVRLGCRVGGRRRPATLCHRRRRLRRDGVLQRVRVEGLHRDGGRRLRSSLLWLRSGGFSRCGGRRWWRRLRLRRLWCRGLWLLRRRWRRRRRRRRGSGAVSPAPVCSRLFVCGRFAVAVAVATTSVATTATHVGGGAVGGRWSECSLLQKAGGAEAYGTPHAGRVERLTRKGRQRR